VGNLEFQCVSWVSMVSRKMDLNFQVSKCLGFSWFSVAAQLEQPLETEVLMPIGLAETIRCIPL
jgi:hypothetical protein